MSEYECGSVRTTQGRAPTGWWRISPAGGQPRWFCSKQCAVNWLVADPGVDLTPWQSAKMLSAMAGRPYHSMLDMTEARLGMLMGRAWNRLVEAVREQSARDALGARLTVEDLLVDR